MTCGAIAQEGNSLDFQWQGSIPGELMPRVINPSGGNVLSANHRATGDWYPLALGLGTGGKGDTNRSARIRELLNALPETASPQEILETMQSDCVDVHRRDVPEMQAAYGGSSLFVKTMNERLAADPNFVSTQDEIAFIDSLLSNAWNEVRNMPSERHRWRQPHCRWQR
jgi:acyl-homoserine lactone acylase PvdQ